MVRFNKYVGIENKWNSVCYFVSTIHLLHSSPTLNELIEKTRLPDGEIYRKCMLRPIALYAKSDDERTIYLLMKKCFNDLAEHVFDESATHGYSPNLLIEYFYLPIIYSISDRDSFVKICSEISIPIVELNRLTYRIEDVISTNPFARAELHKQCIDLYMKMLEFIKTEPRQPQLAMNAWILEVYPNERDSVGGHAIFIYRKSDGRWRILDDASIKTSLSKYIRSRFVARIAIRNISENLVREIEDSIGADYHTMTRRVGNRYEFECSDPERVLKYIQRLE